MRLSALWALVLSVCLCLTSFEVRVATADQEPSEQRVDDVLGPVVVAATRAGAAHEQRLRVAVEPSLSGSSADVLLHAVVERDLSLSGEFDLREPGDFPRDAYTRDTPPELERWRRAGVEALVRLRGVTARDHARLECEVYLTDAAPESSFRDSVEARAGSERLAAHRLTDAVIGALTGRPGGFASRLSFVKTTGTSRQAFVIDADGHELRIASGTHELVSAVNFGPGELPFFAASVAHGRYRLYSEVRDAPFALDPSGSLYAVAFDPTRTRIAVALAVGTSVRVFSGSAAFGSVSLSSRTDIALEPTFSPSGKLAYVGVDHGRSRIYVDGRPVSSRALWASAPTFCEHPNGTRLVYAVRVGKRTDLVSSDERGGTVRRLTRGPDSSAYPACSPDGRLLAFFSTRTRSGGPGLYVMPLSGGPARRISSVVGAGLHWSAVLPE